MSLFGPCACAALVLFFSFAMSRQLRRWESIQAGWIRWVAREVTGGRFDEALSSQRIVNGLRGDLLFVRLCSAPWAVVLWLAAVVTAALPHGGKRA